MRAGIRWWVGGLVFVLAAGSVAPAGAAEIDDLRNAVAAARDAADAATQRYTDAENHLEQLDIDIESLQREIDTNRRRVAELEAITRDRAVAAYKNRGLDLGAFSVTDPMRRARREKMLQETNARDIAAVNKLEALNDALADREDELYQLREQANAARDRLAAEQLEVEAQLRAARQALDAFEERLRREEAARQERERALLAAQRASTARDYSGAYVATGLVCPIRGPVSFVDSWGAPRATTGRHQGVDLMSPRGTPNVAVVSGRAEMRTGATSGLGVWLYGDDGTLYYYFHLDAYAGSPRQVQQGEVVGYTGNTGDASGGATHTHFEIHPGGGPAVNPYPTVVPIC
jgi:murein DD-endopeptidase MepM/ murein hydrolase activator NlpD